MRFLVCLFLVLSLGACGSAQFRIIEEPDPAAEPVARLRVLAFNGVFQGKSDACDKGKLMSGTIVGSMLSSSGQKSRSLGMPMTKSFSDKVDWAEVYIAPNKVFDIRYVYGTNQSGCTVNAYFTPESGHDYEAVGQMSSRQCRLVVFDITGGKMEPVPLSKNADCR